MRSALDPQADVATRRAFGEAWQAWVRAILLDHADDPALIAVVG
jgi:ribosomal protein S12 methylthiotransferase accessory factor YcaO